MEIQTEFSAKYYYMIDDSYIGIRRNIAVFTLSIVTDRPEQTV